MTEPPTRWSRLAGPDSGGDYQRRFDALAASGVEMHGEADFVERLRPAPARVLDAGCGTGRVGIRLAERGYDVIGVDVDPSMLAVARSRAPQVTWALANLADLAPANLAPANLAPADLAPADLAQADQVSDPAPYDVVLLAGNVIPLLAEGTLDATLLGLAALVAPTGVLVAGFGLDRGHLPPRCPVTPLEDYDRACSEAGLSLISRFATWDGEAFSGSAAAGYAVSVHGR